MSDKEIEKPFYRRDLFAEVSKEFADLFGSLVDDFMSPPDNLYSYNDDGSLNVQVEVPGIKPEDLRVSILPEEGGSHLVEVKGETRSAPCFIKSVSESFSVPETYSVEYAQTLEHGLLTLTFPIIKQWSKEEHEKALRDAGFGEEIITEAMTLRAMLEAPKTK